MQEVGGSIPPGSTSLRSLRELRHGKRTERKACQFPDLKAALFGRLFCCRLLTASTAAMHDVSL
jgi:hypothetical protein